MKAQAAGSEGLPAPLAVPFVASLTDFTLEDLPDSTVEKAQLCLIDFLSCAFAARHLPWAGQAMAVAARWPAAEGARVIASRLRLPPSEAAFVNAVMAASACRTDMHPASTAHAAPVVFPVALALAAGEPVSGAEFIAAVVAGYETIGRLGRIMVDGHFRSHFRATAVLGTIGGAITAARLLRLDARAAVHALALAANAASGLMEWE